MPDPATIAQWVSGGVGIGVGIVGAVLKRKLNGENRSRPLFENGEREAVTKMIRELRKELRSFEDDLADLRLEVKDSAKFHRKLIERLETLEARE